MVTVANNSYVNPFVRPIALSLAIAFFPETSEAADPRGTWYLSMSARQELTQRALLSIRTSTAGYSGELDTAWAASSGQSGSRRLVGVTYDEGSNKLSFEFEAPTRTRWKGELNLTGDTLEGELRREGRNLSVRAKRIMEPFRHRLIGEFEYQPDTSNEARIEEQILRATKSMSILYRSFARKRIRFLTKPSPYFRFQETQDGTLVKNPQVTRLCRRDGQASRFQDRRGETSKGFCIPIGLGLQEYFESDGAGQWIHDFSLSFDGLTLYQTVFVGNPQLAHPIRYTLKYRRRS